MSEKPNSGRRSPQEKKKLSYERDCVNVFGQTDKGARTAIPQNKRRAERKLRRAASRLITNIARSESEGSQLDTDLADATLEAIRHTKWQKYRDCPIGVLLDERPVKRHGAADRVRIRNVRDSAQAAIVQNAHNEELYAKWEQKTADRKEVENVERNAKRELRKVAKKPQKTGKE